MVRWLPLESNPAVMNKLLHGMGMSASWQVSDVYGLDEGLLAMVPQPVAALLLLYPMTEQIEDMKKKQHEAYEATGQTAPGKVYFMKQCVGNACGTVALIHAVANNTDKIELADGALKDFLEKTKVETPEAKGQALEVDEGIAKAHEESAHQGQTEAPEREVSLDTHFIALVGIDGELYEFDGRRNQPICHGKTSPDTFLQDAAVVCKKVMETDPGESRFALVALASAE